MVIPNQMSREWKLISKDNNCVNQHSHTSSMPIQIIIHKNNGSNYSTLLYTTKGIGNPMLS